MKLNKRNILIGTGLLLVAGTVTYIIVRRTKNAKKIKALNDILDGRIVNPNVKEGDDNYWNPSYMNKYSQNPAFWQRSDIKKFTQDLAKMIYDSVGTVYDDPQLALTAFKQINSKVGVSAVSSAFSQKYNKDMFTYLETGFDTTDQKKTLAEIKQNVDSKPVIAAGQ
jgi:predicted small secreted protein